jgi:cytochrome c biogenesis protein CcdA
MMIPGILFIALGVLIILYPQILAWLIAIALVAMGIAMLMMIKFRRGIGRRIQ